MRIAAEYAAAGCAHGTAIVSDQQTGGIGRQGHAWHSEPASGLYVSVVLRIAEPTPILTLALGLATVDAIRNVAGLACDLRWPNDVLIGERKLAGILVQMAGTAAIAGIGINVNHNAFPSELANLATSLYLQTGRTHSREELLMNLLTCIDDCCTILQKRGEAAILTMFSTVSSYAQGKRVKVDLGDRTIEGVTAGLDNAGFLRVRRTDGTTETVLAGGVRPA